MKLKSNRKCEECVACCEGWLSAEIHGHIMRPGMKCHFLGKTCSIYENRPDDPCKTFKCVWLEDEHYDVPEWLKPNISKIIITRRPWGQNKQNIFWSVVECGEKMNSDVLHWLLNYCDYNNIPLEYQFDGHTYIRGNKEFNDYMMNKNNGKL